MFPPNHPHYGTNRRRFRCPTGNKRIGLIAVIGICLFLCGFFVAFEATHDQHILKGIDLQYIPMIPHPIYPHSEPNEEHLANEDRRRLDGDGGSSNIEPAKPQPTWTFEQRHPIIDTSQQNEEIVALLRLLRPFTMEPHPSTLITPFLVQQFTPENGGHYQLKVSNETPGQGGQRVLTSKEAANVIEEWAKSKNHKADETYVNALKFTRREDVPLNIEKTEKNSNFKVQDLTWKQKKIKELEGYLEEWRQIKKDTLEKMKEDLSEKYEVHLTSPEAGDMQL